MFERYSILEFSLDFILPWLWIFLSLSSFEYFTFNFSSHLKLKKRKNLREGIVKINIPDFLYLSTVSSMKLNLLYNISVF